MKRYIRSNTIETTEGFFLEVGNRAIFFKTEGVNITDRVIRKFINTICDIKGVGNNIRQAALYDKPTLADFRRRITKAVLEEVNNPGFHYFSVKGKNFTLNFPEDDFQREVVVIE